ncbi:MAG: hypothetical protein IT204_08740 [Fimbriimonadaceae bacterium]|nr:hypothetical protein [Fimbriimonadaceae bacterium]
MGSPATTASHAANPLTGPGTYVYDGNGNPTTFGGTALTWDVENRMTAHGTALEAAYRGDGLRAWKEGATRTYFLYDGINVVCELDAAGDLVAASTFGAAGLLSRGEVQYQFDPLGDAVHLLDAAGDVLANRLFDAWGNELTSGDVDPRGYRAKYGYYTDEETGLVALAYRYYGPGVGRFLNRDPIGYEGGVNVYGYVASGTTSRSDPRGLWPANHGNWCGLYNSGPGMPVDQVDACCKSHDECLTNSGCMFYMLARPECLQCHYRLCRCVAGSYCTSFDCLAYAAEVWIMFSCGFPVFGVDACKLIGLRVPPVLD